MRSECELGGWRQTEVSGWKWLGLPQGMFKLVSQLQSKVASVRDLMTVVVDLAPLLGQRASVSLCQTFAPGKQTCISAHCRCA